MAHHDDQGSSDRPFYLTVRFDRDRIDATLRTLGDAPFAGRRPTVTPVVVVTNTRSAYVLTSGGPHAPGQREALADAADRLGMPVHLPATGQLADGATLAGTGPLTGTPAWSDAAHGWVGDWSMPYHGTPHVWRSEGGSYDLAFRAAMQVALGVVAGHAP